MEEQKKTREVRAIFEVMAKFAGDVEATPSMMEDVDVDDDVPMGHVSKPMEMAFRLGVRTELMTSPNLRRRTPWVDSK